MLLKKAKESWKGNFDKLLDKAERKEFANAKRYYQGEYLKAIEDFQKTGKTNGFDNLFRVADFTEIYRQVYVNIGLKFAKWYAKNFDKVISKQVDVSGYDDIWAERFNTVSQQIAAERVVLVQGTAKATLIKVFKQLSSDPEFMAMNEREAQRILRQKFGQYSKSQAERLIRTEATNAANVATLQSATDMFGQESLQKEWMTAVDGRERPAHRAADAQIVDFKERFLVGGEQLFNPGDPAGSAKNVVNCRCSTAPFPKEDAQATGTIEGFGVRPPGGSAQSVLRTPKPVREAVREVVNDLPDVKTIKEGKEVATKILKDAGVDINAVTISSGLDVKTLNEYLKQLNKLTNKYKINSAANSQGPVKLIFKSSKRMYGFVERSKKVGESSWKLKRINLGDKSESATNVTREVFTDKFQRLPKSPIDLKNQSIGTLTHEFAHIIAHSENAIDADFFDELRVIFREYKESRVKYANSRNFKAFNEMNLGSYASTEIDEFLAEGFKEYQLLSNPSKYATLIGELVNKYYKL